MTYITHEAFKSDMQTFIGTVPDTSSRTLEELLGADVLPVVMQHILEGNASIAVRFYGVDDRDDEEDEYRFDPVDPAQSTIEGMRSAVFEWLERGGNVMFFASWPNSNWTYYLGKWEAFSVPWDADKSVNTLMGLCLATCRVAQYEPTAE